MYQELIDYYQDALKNKTLTLKQIQQIEEAKEYLPKLVLFYINECNGILNDVPLHLIDTKVLKEYIKKNIMSETFLYTMPLDNFPKQLTMRILYHYFIVHTNNNTFDIKMFPDKYQKQGLISMFSEKLKWEKYYQKFRMIKKIPPNYRTKEMCLDFFNRTSILYDIPIQFITKEMAKKHLDDRQNLGGIPPEFLDQEMCEKYYNLTGKIHQIPEQFITEKMAQEYFKNTKDVKSIPKKYQTQEMYDEYYQNTNDLNSVPDEYKTAQMCLDYFEKNCWLTKIPERFITQKMVQEYIERRCSLSDIPQKFFTQVLCDYYFDNGYNPRIEEIPEQFRSPEICIKYMQIIEKRLETFSKANRKKFLKREFKAIPLICRNQSIWDIYYRITNDFADIPRENITSEMCNDYFQKHQSLKEIPEEFITKKMCDHYFKKYHNLEGMPEEYITKEMAKEYATQSKSIINVPIEYLDDEIIDIVKESNKNFFNEITTNTKRQIIEKELYHMIKNGGTKKMLVQKYNTTEKFIDSVMEQIKDKDHNTYMIIKQFFEHNSNQYIHSCIKEAAIINEIIKSLGPINKKLTNEQKIFFAYQINRACLKRKISEVYSFISKFKSLSEEFSQVIDFCQKQLFYRYVEMQKEGEILLYNEEKYQLKKGNNWLQPYKIVEQFETKDGKKITNQIRNTNGEIVEIDETIASKIITYLITNQVPVVNCIVNEAIRKYVSGELEEFVIKLTSNDYLANKIKE